MLIYDRNERLEENISKSYINRSRLYLASSIELYKSYDILKPSLKDVVAMGCGINKPEGLLLIFAVNGNFGNVLNLIEIAKQHKEYVDDCIIDKNHHAIVLKPLFNLDNFIRGNYTEIYTIEQMKIFRGSEKVYPVITKDKKYFPKFVQYMKSNFDAEGSAYLSNNLTEDDLKDYPQYDIPPCLQQEIIWHKS